MAYDNSGNINSIIATGIRAPQVETLGDAFARMRAQKDAHAAAEQQLTLGDLQTQDGRLKLQQATRDAQDDQRARDIVAGNYKTGSVPGSSPGAAPPPAQNAPQAQAPGMPPAPGPAPGQPMPYSLPPGQPMAYSPPAAAPAQPMPYAAPPSMPQPGGQAALPGGGRAFDVDRTIAQFRQAGLLRQADALAASSLKQQLDAAAAAKDQGQAASDFATAAEKRNSMLYQGTSYLSQMMNPDGSPDTAARAAAWPQVRDHMIADGHVDPRNATAAYPGDAWLATEHGVAGSQADKDAQAIEARNAAKAPAELEDAQNKAAQSRRMLAGTNAAGVTGQEQVANAATAARDANTAMNDSALRRQGAGQLGVSQAELQLRRDTFRATLGSGLDVNGQPLSPEALKASAMADPEALAIAHYQIQGPPPTTRNGQPAPIYRKILAINPDYDNTQFAARNKTQQDFSPGGATGKAITGSDTAMAHLNSISLAGKALDSGDIQQLNRLASFVGAQTGSAAPTVYDSIVATVAPEISKAVIGGPGGEAERAKMAANFSRNLSAAQREGAVGANVALIKARVEKQYDAYQQQMGRPLARQLSPESQAVMQRYAQQQPAAQPATNPYR